MQTRIENGAGPRFTGLGVWNVYFIIAFALAAFGYIELNLLGNALLMAWLLLPVGPKWLLGVPAAAVLLYSESWLPGVDSILANKGGIAGFSLLYMAEFALDFINVKMVGWGLLVFLGYFLVRRYVRVTFFTIVYFLGAVTMPWVQSILPERAPVVTADAGDARRGETRRSPPPPPRRARPTPRPWASGTTPSSPTSTTDAPASRTAFPRRTRRSTSCS